MSRRVLLLPLLLAVLLAGCGSNEERRNGPLFGRPAGADAGAPATTSTNGETPTIATPIYTATKNTTRIAGATSAELAAGAARAVFPSNAQADRPGAVVMVADGDWRAGLPAAALMAPPLRAPLLVSTADKLPDATSRALDVLDPPGAPLVGDAQVIRIGTRVEAGDRKTRDISAPNPFALAAQIDALRASVAGTRAPEVVLASIDDPASAMPAAAWAAKSGDALLWTEKDRLPPETRAAIATRPEPDVYVLGEISEVVRQELEQLGSVTEIDGDTPTERAIAFARFSAGGFGWDVVDPGHGLVFARKDRPLDAAAAAPLSAAGTFGPLLLLEGRDELPDAVREYLLDIQPGYEDDPTRAVYNHGWLMGDERAISTGTQAAIDALLEIQPIDEGA